jgi:hypothetical protein
MVPTCFHALQLIGSGTARGCSVTVATASISRAEAAKPAPIQRAASHVLRLNIGGHLTFAVGLPDRVAKLDRQLAPDTAVLAGICALVSPYVGWGALYLSAARNARLFGVACTLTLFAIVAGGLSIENGVHELEGRAGVNPRASVPLSGRKSSRPTTSPLKVASKSAGHTGKATQRWTNPAARAPVVAKASVESPQTSSQPIDRSPVTTSPNSTSETGHMQPGGAAAEDATAPGSEPATSPPVVTVHESQEQSQHQETSGGGSQSQSQSQSTTIVASG